MSPRDESFGSPKGYFYNSCRIIIYFSENPVSRKYNDVSCYDKSMIFETVNELRLRSFLRIQFSGGEACFCPPPIAPTSLGIESTVGACNYLRDNYSRKKVQSQGALIAHKPSPLGLMAKRFSANCTSQVINGRAHEFASHYGSLTSPVAVPVAQCTEMISFHS